MGALREDLSLKEAPKQRRRESYIPALSSQWLSPTAVLVQPAILLKEGEGMLHVLTTVAPAVLS